MFSEASVSKYFCILLTAYNMAAQTIQPNLTKDKEYCDEQLLETEIGISINMCLSRYYIFFPLDLSYT